jgi:hypothetical protein
VKKESLRVQAQVSLFLPPLPLMDLLVAESLHSFDSDPSLADPQLVFE